MELESLFKSLAIEDNGGDVENIISVRDKNGSNIAHQLLLRKSDETTLSLSQRIDYLISLPQGSELFKMTNNDGRTPLHELLASENPLPKLEILERILKNSGETINARDTYGNTMFLSAALKGDSLSCLKCLKNLGADHMVSNKRDHNSLYMSVEFGSIKSVEYLVSIGVPIENPDFQGNTPLHLAAWFQKMDVIKYFIAEGANILAINNDASNFLHLLLTNKHDDETILKDFINLLMSRPEGPQLFQMKNKRMETPLRMWLAFDNVNSLPDRETVAMILGNCGEDVNETDSNGNTLLLHAAAKKDSRGRKIDVIKYLIEERAANVLVVNCHGLNIAHCLVIPKQDDNVALKQCVEYLMSLPKGPELFARRGKWERTPLCSWLASENSFPHPETIAKVLNISGEEVNATDSYGNTLFLLAAAKPDALDCLKCLKDAGADHTATNGDGWNALDLSAQNGILESIKYLESMGLSVDHANMYGNTPLHHAVYLQKLDAFTYLVGQGANVLAVNHDGSNIAHWIVIRRWDDQAAITQRFTYLLSLREASQLFKMRNKNGRTPLGAWIMSENSLPEPEIIRLIMQCSGEDVNETDVNGDTMFLMAASKHDSLSCLKCLTDMGADFAGINKLGRNAVHMSAGFGSLESVQHLVSLGVPFDEHPDFEGYTPLHLAAWFQKADVIKYLIEKGADILKIQTNGRNIVHLLLSGKFDETTGKEILKYLISLPQGPLLFKMRNKWERTPLHEWFHSENSLPRPDIIAQILGTSGEEINATDSNGNTMFLLAARKPGAVDCLKCLKDAGAVHTVTDRWGRNAVALSAQNGILESVEYLVSIGVSPNLPDNYGYAPLHEAVILQNPDVIIKCLIGQGANVLAVDEDGNNIAHLLVAEKLNDQTVLKEAMEYLFSLPEGRQLFIMENKKGTTPLQAWSSSAPGDETMKMIRHYAGEAEEY